MLPLNDFANSHVVLGGWECGEVVSTNFFFNAEHFIVTYSRILYRRWVRHSNCACSCLVSSANCRSPPPNSFALQGRRRQRLLVKTHCSRCTTIHWLPHICRHWIGRLEFIQGCPCFLLTWRFA